MGQVISKRIMPRLSKAVEAHERAMAEDALQDIARKQAQAKASNTKYSDPSALEGFRRDEWTKIDALPTDQSQRDYLHRTKSGSPQEMPDDLIQFLNDAGPLKRKVDKDLTSAKVYDSLLEEEEQRRQQLQQESQRRRRVMPMVGDADLNADVDGNNPHAAEHKLDGTTVSRTTNFSTAVRDINVAQIRLEDRELFRLLSQLQTNQTAADEFVEDKYKDLDSAAVTDEQREESIALIENIKKFTAIPMLMQDTDKSIVGAWPGNLDHLKQLHNVRTAPSNVKLSFAHDLEEQMKMMQSMKPSITVEDRPEAVVSTSKSESASGSVSSSTDVGVLEEDREPPKMSTAEFLHKAKSSS